MSYDVRLLPRARLQLFNSALWWAEHRSRKQAAEWLSGFESALRSLGTNPERCSLAQESDAFPFELREITYGVGRRKTHRALFEIRHNEIIVYAIRHLAQDSLTADDI